MTRTGKTGTISRNRTGARVLARREAGGGGEHLESG
jgi:hypothetical protein